MKRSFLPPNDEENLSLEELRERSIYYDKKYREAVCLLMDSFFSVGETVFKTHVINPLSRLMWFPHLLELRLVCKRWSIWILHVDHLHLLFRSMKNYTRVLQEMFKNVRSLKMDRTVLGPHIANERITSLEINEEDDDSEDADTTFIDMETWTSLERLVIPKNISIINTPLTLKYLECCSDAFPREDELYSLVNLTHLSINNFSPSLEVSRLTNLIYLDSDHPRHFSSYTGRGRLISWHGRTDDTSKENTEFDAYYPDSRFISITGQWSCGKLVGQGNGAFIYGKDNNRFQLSGPLMNGKPDGTQQESCSTHVYMGEWKLGVRDGPGKRYAYPRIDGEMVLLSEEEWKEGRRVRCVYSTYSS